MKDPERLHRTGTDDDRRLLDAARTIPVPPALQDQIRRRLEERLPGRRPPLRLLAGVGLLLAGAAAAFPLWRSLQPVPTPPPTTSPAPRPVIIPQPQPQPQPQPEPEPEPVPSSPSPGHPRRLAATPPPAPPAPESPGLDLPGFRRGALDPTPPVPPTAPSPHLVIARANRHTITLEASATRVRGSVRGRAIDLTFAGKELTGRIGDDAVLIRIFGKVRAEGQAGGVDLLFGFVPTERGWLVNANLPDVGGRVELDDRRLGFYPGCGAGLLAVQGLTGEYEGRCADDTVMRIKLPPAFLEMPPLARLVILGMILPEPDPLLRDEKRGLFPPP